MPSLAEPTERLPYEVPLTLDPLDMADFTKLKNKDLEGFSLDGKPGEMEQVMEELWEKFMEQSRFNLTDLDEEQHKKMDRCFDDFVTAYYDPNRDPRACPSMFDEVSCWPETSPGTLRTIECFTVFKDIMYDNVGKNATLDCFQNGLWSKKANYTDCLNFVGNNSSKDTSTVNTITTIFYVGNSLSLVAVLLALWIFISFKDLRCLRNTIHTNLLFTYLFHNFCWIVYAFVQTIVNEIFGCSFFVALNYFTLTNFMWMFVEGFYLYMLVVKTFSVENIKLRVYTLIGWGAPVPIIFFWALLKSHLTITHSKTELDEAGMEGHELEGIVRNCPLMPDSTLDWIQKVPVLFVLSTNVIFLTHIMWVLITKLRSANTVETQRYRKATKALLVLIPLLGLTYMLLIALPQELEHVRAILLSTQGFWVALFYCFLNSEVQNSIRHHIERWKTARGLSDTRSSSVRRGRDGSPRPRTDCSSYGRRLFGSKRESLCSEVTTMTTFVANGYNPVSTQTGPVLPLQQQQPLLQQPQQQPIQQQQLASSSHLNFRNSTAGLIQNCGDQDGKPTVRDSLL
ncbi:diuretic hormone receptor [Cherax quadricarinatus]|uniref:diuretic hormone receptor n=1 Tax=Cherax quadricarinatus TaxID=27406 RepID=UPI00387E8483